MLGADVLRRASLEGDSIRSVWRKIEFLDERRHQLGPYISEEGTGTIQNRVVLGNGTLVINHWRSLTVFGEVRDG